MWRIESNSSPPTRLIRQLLQLIFQYVNSGAKTRNLFALFLYLSNPIHFTCPAFFSLPSWRCCASQVRHNRNSIPSCTTARLKDSPRTRYTPLSRTLKDTCGFVPTPAFNATTV